jgi:hypothetical protein
MHPLKRNTGSFQCEQTYSKNEERIKENVGGSEFN